MSRQLLTERLLAEKSFCHPCFCCLRTPLLAVIALVIATGCMPSNSSPEFRLNMQDILAKMGHKPEEFDAYGDEDARAAYKKLQFLSSALEAAFGTPDEPFLFKEAQWNPDEKKGLDLRKIKLAAGKFGGNKDGTQRGLFRQHCAHCHGVSGDGAGPTAAFLNPFPRDYR